MLIVLFIIFLIGVLIGTILVKIYNESSYSDCNEGLGIVGGLMLVCSVIGLITVIIFLILCAFEVSKLKIADEKIKMYETENKNIQKQVSEIVENYKIFEKDTYTESLEKIDIQNIDLLVLSQLYPDLKSNDLVKEQIKIYQENNKKIKQIKEEKLNCQVYKWWLCFDEIN